jgi:hypothetical protein
LRRSEREGGLYGRARRESPRGGRLRRCHRACAQPPRAAWSFRRPGVAASHQTLPVDQGTNHRLRRPLDGRHRIASAAMLRLGGVAACSACLWVVLGAFPVVAMRSDTVATARVAARLAAIIRRDALQAERSKDVVTVVRRCCGKRVLRIHYRVKLAGDIVAGAYVLRLETARGVVQGIGLFESASELDPRLGSHGEKNWRLVFVIHHESHTSSGGWSSGGSYQEGELGGESNGASFGASSIRECRLPGRVPTAVYHELLRVLIEAPRHDLVHPDPATAC